MTTAQDQQSRAELLPCPFCGGAPELVDDRVEWFVRCNECKPFATVVYGRSARHIDHISAETDEEANALARAASDAFDWDALKQSAIDAWNRRAPAEQAARALPAGKVGRYKLDTGPTGADDGGEILRDSLPWFGADSTQVQAMGRVPPAAQEPLTYEQIVEIDEQALRDIRKRPRVGYCELFARAIEAAHGIKAAAPQPPAAQDCETPNYCRSVLRCTAMDEQRAAPVARERHPLDGVAAMKLGMAADDATRKHCRGTTNWAHALTRFYEKALERMPTWEPKFDVMAPGQEDLAVQFCNEISGPLGKPGRAPDPVRLLEMAEELYKAERDAAHGIKEAL